MILFQNLQVCILDGNRYNKRCREAGEQRLDILDDCEVLLLCSKFQPKVPSKATCRKPIFMSSAANEI